MKTLQKIFLVLTGVACVFGGARADWSSPSNSCSEPYKPYKFTEQYQVDSYNNEVDAYKRCIDSFVDEQSDAARSHADAAQRAISEWNSFVRYN